MIEPGSPEYAACMKAFERRERQIYWPNLRKRRKKVLSPGEGRYVDPYVNERWMVWAACWSLLREER